MFMCVCASRVSETAADEAVKAPVVNQWEGEDEEEEEGE